MKNHTLFLLTFIVHSLGAPQLVSDEVLQAVVGKMALLAQELQEQPVNENNEQILIGARNATHEQSSIRKLLGSQDNPFAIACNLVGDIQRKYSDTKFTEEKLRTHYFGALQAAVTWESFDFEKDFDSLFEATDSKKRFMPKAKIGYDNTLPAGQVIDDESKISCTENLVDHPVYTKDNSRASDIHLHALWALHFMHHAELVACCAADNKIVVWLGKPGDKPRSRWGYFDLC